MNVAPEFVTLQPFHWSEPPAATGARLKLRKFLQAAFDIFVVCFWVAFVTLIFCAVVGSFFAMLLFKF